MQSKVFFVFLVGVGGSDCVVVVPLMTNLIFFFFLQK